MKAKPNKYMTFLPEHKDVEVSHSGQTVLEAALAAKIEINHTCGGFGTCGTCRVWVLEGIDLLTDRNDIESELARDRGLAATERLACQIHAYPGLVLKR